MRSYSGILVAGLLAATIGTQPASAQTSFRIGPSIISIPAFVRGTAAAYDYKNGVYLVVGAYGNLNGVFVTADGAVGASFPINGPFSHFPSVAYSPDINGGAGGFLVTWHLSVGSGAMVHGKIVTSSGVVGPDLTISAGGSWWEAAADVAYSTTSKEFLVVWQGIGILAQRVGLNGELLGTNFSVNPPVHGRDPAVAYNPATNEFMVSFGDIDAASDFAAAQRVAAGSGALVGPEIVVGRALQVYITEIAYNARSNQYLVAWYQGGTYARLLDAAGNAASGIVLAGTSVSAYDALGIDYNATSGTFMMVSHLGSSFQDGAVELNGTTAVPGLAIIATDIAATKGNFYPKVAARAGKAEWLLSTATDFAATTVQRLGSSNTGGPAPLTVTMTANRTMPVPDGTAITFTATGAGGTGPYQYQFYQYSNATGWVLMQAYSGVNTFTWTPPEGPHTVQVWVRNSGSSNAYDAYAGSSFTVTSAAATLTSFAPNVPWPPAAGVPVTWTATAVGGSAVEYQFWRYSTATGWFIAQPYSGVNTFTIYPSFGTNVVQVWVRRVGSTAAYEDWRGTGVFDVGASPARVFVSPSAAISSPGVPVTFFATGGGGSGPLEYKFFIYAEGYNAWFLLRDWSTNTQAAWIPGAGSSGLYRVQAWVRTVGSGVAYENWSNTQPFSITASTSLTLVANRSVAILRQGDVVTFTASVTGPVGAWEYKFVLFNGSSWVEVAPYSGQNYFVWAATAGTAVVQVWGRPAGSLAPYERWANLGPFVVSP